MLKPLALGLGLLLLFGEASATAQAVDEVALTPDGRWKLVKTHEGCAFILHSSDNQESDEQVTISGRSRHWSGACGADGLASGPGVLTSSYHNSSVVGSANMRFEIRGTASAGVFEGGTTDTVYSDASGAMRVMDFGVPEANPSEDVRTGGCLRMYPSCDSGTGRQLSATVRVRGAASYFGGGASGSSQLAEVSGVAAPTGGLVTAVATPAAGAGRKPFLNSCLSLKAPEGDREPGSWGANVWTIQNSCQTKLYVTWCADEDSRETLPNICANKAAATNEILAGGTIIFQSAERELSIQAFACRAPDFPQDADFTEDRRLTASGCP